MQKIINGIAILSGVISLTVLGSCVFIYLQKDAIIENVKGKVMDAVMPDIGSGITDAIPEMTGPAIPNVPGIPKL